MKVLDLGSHDGWIGQWLQERFDGKLTIDGMELHPGAADKARRRGYRKVVRDIAEHAPEHFHEGSYDAVVAFELIEHVPDPERLLEVCERMLRPDGRIYLSTPDGTFGQGQNPHHLRAYRAIDLADQIRRRGRILDMGVGPDTISCAAYTPGPKTRGEVAIFTGPSWQRWAPMDIDLKGLGGSETAAVRLAEQLAKLGYVVTVYGDVDDGCFADVIFRHWTAFDPAERRQAVIASRLPEVYERPVNAQVRLLWLHDTDCGPRLTERFADQIDRVLVLSDWQRRHVEGLYPFLRRDDQDALSKVAQIRNGIHLSYFEGDQPERRKRVVYTSSPDRGLDVLLELWPEIRAEVPDAELAWAYSPVYFAIADQDETVAKHAARIRELSEQDGVETLGSLSQPEIAALMRSSLVWCAPSWNTPHQMPFNETSCIGAMEAQAAGCHVVASGWGALPETVRVGHLVNGDAPGPRWRHAIVRGVVDGLTDTALQQHAQEKGPEAAAQLGWDGVATQVAGLLEGELVEEPCAAV